MGVCVEPLICPICGSSFIEIERALKCPAGHSFDVSREGYVNLLLVRGRQPKIMGDTRDMLQARREFLDRDHYAPLSDAINQCVADHLDDQAKGADELLPISIVDVGCGEGYTIGRLKRYLDRQLRSRDICYFGMDISKEAARLAARRHKEIRFVVADIRRKALFSDRSVRVVLNVFAPRNGTELARITVPGGILLVVIPNPDHLMNLRTELGLLGMEVDKEQRVIEQLAEPFALAEKRSIAYEVNLKGKDLLNLVRMTPNYWHSTEETWENVKALGSVCTRASFTLLEFRRLS